MSVDGDGKDGKVTPLRSVPPEIANHHGPLVFQVRLFADGHLDWVTPVSPDPAINEIIFRGYFDKVRETIFDSLKATGRRIIS